MKAIIDVFRMPEVSERTRANIIIKLGQAINHEYAMNITEALVYELVQILDPSNSILTDEHYLRHIAK